MFKVGDKVVTRDGRKGRIVIVDAKNDTMPIIALIESSFGELCCQHTITGDFECSATPNNLDIKPLVDMDYYKKLLDRTLDILERVELFGDSVKNNSDEIKDIRKMRNNGGK